MKSQESNVPGLGEQTPKVNENIASTPVNAPESSPVISEADKEEAAAEKVLNIRSATADVKIEMTSTELSENLTEAKINTVIDNPEKAKSFFSNLKTVLSTVSKFVEDKTFDVLSPALVKMYEFYKANEKTIDRSIQVAGGLVTVGGLAVAASYDEGARSDMIKIGMGVGGIIVGGGAALVEGININIKKDKEKRVEAKAAKMQQQAMA